MPPALTRTAPQHWGAIILLLVAGIALRLLHQGEHGSDVLAVTRSAIQYVAAGLNPYGHGYASSDPAGAPYPYGPLALAWYAVTPDNVELLASVSVLFFLASTGRLIGLAIWALWTPFAILANDGSNDTSVGLLLLGTVVLAERSPRLGAAALGAVVAFKPYALAFLPPLVAYGGPAVLVPFAAVSAAAWLPAVAIWGAGPIATSLRGSVMVHGQAYSSLAEVLHLGVRTRPLLLLLQLSCGALSALASLFLVRSPRAMVGWGAVIFLLTLFTGWWATVAYLAAIAPPVCWYVDAWYDSIRSRRPIRALATGGEAGLDLARPGETAAAQPPGR